MVEKLLGLEIPKRAQYIRVVLDEMQRISSHLLWLATAAIDLGAITPFFYTFREREVILDLFEDYCGARLTLNCMRVGGLQEELTPGWIEKLRAFTEDLGSKIDEYEDLLTENRIWKERTIGVGILNDGALHRVGRHGPAAPRRRPRVGHPPGDPVRVLSGARLRDPDRQERRHVRPLPRADRRAAPEPPDPPPVLRLARRRTPTGEIRGKVPRVIKPPAGDVYASVESPKGELGFYLVSNGGNKPYRLRVRPPSFINLQALPEMARGHLVSDLVAIIGTIDIVLGEVDR